MTYSFVTSFGSKLLNSLGKETSPQEALIGKDQVLLYFSAHWCPPCRRFTPVLAELYSKLKSDGKNFELVFCSLDNDEEEYKEYTATMPWLCMPFDAPESKVLARKYKADGIPHLVILNGDGEVITMEGTGEVMDDSEGKNFPWKPKSFRELWTAENVLVNKEPVTSSTLKDKHLMLYFSASWCPPCRMFTPKLSEAYTKMKALGHDFELLFISSDRDQDSFDEYYKKMSFGALPFEHRELKSALSKKFGVSGIPKLIMLGPEDENGERPLINDSVRSFIESSDFGDFPFHKKNYGDVENGEGLNENMALIIFHENGDDDEQDQTKALVKDVAEKLKERDGDGAMDVFWALSPGGIGQQIRKLTKLPAVEEAEDAAMIILDIPDNGGYYKSNVTDLDAEKVMAFISNPGDRLQLS
jgi:nucleoredoxin